MSANYKGYGLTWNPLPDDLAPAQARIAAILDAWKGTPYMGGQQVRGVGVDCVRFCSSVMDEIERKPKTPIETLPPDAALHTREGAMSVMRLIRASYMPNVQVKDGQLQPGDVIVVGPRGGGPGHAMIVGGRTGEIWHASRSGVVRTGTSFADDNFELFRIYRKEGRETWL